MVKVGGKWIERIGGIRRLIGMPVGSNVRLGCLSMLWLWAAGEAVASEPLVLTVEVGRAQAVTPHEVRKAVVKEVAGKVLSAHEKQDRADQDILLVDICQGTANFLFKGYDGQVRQRSLELPTRREDAPKVIAWMAQNLVRESEEVRESRVDETSIFRNFDVSPGTSPLSPRRTVPMLDRPLPNPYYDEPRENPFVEKNAYADKAMVLSAQARTRNKETARLSLAAYAGWTLAGQSIPTGAGEKGLYGARFEGEGRMAFGRYLLGLAAGADTHTEAGGGVFFGGLRMRAGRVRVEGATGVGVWGGRREWRELNAAGAASLEPRQTGAVVFWSLLRATGTVGYAALPWLDLSFRLSADVAPLRASESSLASLFGVTVNL